MQWSDEPNGGFSTAATVVRTPVERGPYAYRHVNVEEQRRDPTSLLQWTARMIRLRKQCPEIGWGDWRIVPTGSRAVLAIEYRWRASTIVSVHNLADEPREATLELDVDTLANLVDVEQIEADRGGVHHVVVEPYGYRWFRAGAVTPALARDVAG
jgi:maltose alpha-D-glucosyltransferase/alpha-amylase